MNTLLLISTLFFLRSQAQYIDNTAQLLQYVNLSTLKGLFEPGFVEKAGKVPDSQQFVSSQDLQSDERIHFGPTTAHTKDNCYIVKISAGAKRSTLNDFCKLVGVVNGARLRGQLSSLGAAVVCFAEGMLPAKLLKAIPGLEMVERDMKVKAALLPKQSLSKTSADWALSRISHDSGAYSSNYTGAGVTAYVVDSGIQVDNPEFGGRASIGYSVYGSTVGEDCSGHGTSVASCIGGKTVGVAPGCKLVSVQVLDCEGQGEISGMLMAVDWLKRNARKPCVINMSFVGERSALMDDAIRQLIDGGYPVVIAAGNFNKNACDISPSSSRTGAMSIGAINQGDKRASFSNYGTCVTLFAPGVGVPVALKSGKLGTESGTSFSAPLVAGVCAQLLQKLPRMPPSDMKAVLKEIAARGQLSDLNGSPNILVQSPVEIVPKAVYDEARDQGLVISGSDGQMAEYEGYLIFSTPVFVSSFTPAPAPPNVNHASTSSLPLISLTSFSVGVVIACIMSTLA